MKYGLNIFTMVHLHFSHEKVDTKKYKMGILFVLRNLIFHAVFNRLFKQPNK